MLKFNLIFIFLFATNVIAEELVKRNIIALWKKDRYITEFHRHKIHKKFESILNFYGYRVHAFEVSKGLPQKIKNNDFLKTVAGVVTWYHDDKFIDPSDYIKWMGKLLDKKIKFIVFGRLGFESNSLDKPTSLTSINDLLRRMGIEHLSEDFTNPIMFEVKKNKGSSFTEFERNLQNEIKSIQRIVSVDKKNDVWLSYKIRDSKKYADPIIVSRKGAIIQEGFGLFENPITFHTQWRVNPFRLIEAVFTRNPLTPIPDITTINGNRTFFSHIDGDGFHSLSKVDRKSYCGEIIYEKILKKYRLPVTTSVVVAEVDKNFLGNDRIQKAVKNIFSEDYIEIASHTYSHPLSWLKKATSDEIRDYGKKPNKYGNILSYKLGDYALNYEYEIQGSVDYINNVLAPEDKKNKVVLWSGSCEPPKEAVKIVKDIGNLNMNGGDGRFDKSFNSYSHLAPLYNKLGDYYQVYSANANENLYTNVWNGPYVGFKDVIETFKNTESPIRFKPINVYYHFYSGEFHASLKALSMVYDYSISQSITPVFASSYINQVNDFIQLEVFQLGTQTFKVVSNGELRTFRVDNPKGFYLNYKKSQNVIGSSMINNQLYIFLGDKRESIIKFSRKEIKLPHVTNCNCILNNFSKSEENIEIEGELFVDKGMLSIYIPDITKVNLEKNSKIEGNVLKIPLKSRGKFAKTVKFKVSQ